MLFTSISTKWKTLKNCLNILKFRSILWKFCIIFDSIIFSQGIVSGYEDLTHWFCWPTIIVSFCEFASPLIKCQETLRKPVKKHITLFFKGTNKFPSTLQSDIKFMVIFQGRGVCTTQLSESNLEHRIVSMFSVSWLFK